MNIDRRITNGLAWAGALIVVAIPTADLLSAQFAGKPEATAAAVVLPETAPVPAPLAQRPDAPVAMPEPKTAAVTPAKPVEPVAKPADVVDSFLQSGRALPSYITGAEAPAAVAVVAPPARTPIVTAPAATPAAPTVAAAVPQKVAPVPMPLSMRPKPVAVALVRDAVIVPPDLSPVLPVGTIRPPANVTAADLEDWETGPLADFLAQRQAGNLYAEPGYEAGGFFLNEGPGGVRVIAREADPFFFAE